MLVFFLFYYFNWLRRKNSKDAGAIVLNIAYANSRHNILSMFTLRLVFQFIFIIHAFFASRLQQLQRFLSSSHNQISFFFHSTCDMQ